MADDYREFFVEAMHNTDAPCTAMTSFEFIPKVYWKNVYKTCHKSERIIKKLKEKGRSGRYV